MTLRLTPAMTAALRSGASPVVPLIRAELPGYVMCHLVGSGEVDFGGSRYRGQDPRFGALLAAGDVEDGGGDEAPDWDLTFAPPDDAAVEDLTDPAIQGGRVTGWLAVIDRATGAPVPEPIQVFEGTIDIARLRVGKASRTVEWRCVSALEPFHDVEKGQRLSDAFHRMVWPGETGLANMSGIEKTSYWGVEKPPSAVTNAPAGLTGLFR